MCIGRLADENGRLLNPSVDFAGGQGKFCMRVDVTEEFPFQVPKVVATL